MKNPKLGALWIKKSQNDGKTYMSGVIERDMAAALFMRAVKEEGDLRIVCFLEDKKGNNKMPDFRIVLSEPQEQRQQIVNDDFGDVFGSGMPSGPVKVNVLPDEIPVVEQDEPNTNNEGFDDGEIDPANIPF